MNAATNAATILHGDDLCPRADDSTLRAELRSIISDMLEHGENAPWCVFSTIGVSCIGADVRDIDLIRFCRESAEERNPAFYAGGMRERLLDYEMILRGDISDER